MPRLEERLFILVFQGQGSCQGCCTELGVHYRIVAALQVVPQHDTPRYGHPASCLPRSLGWSAAPPRRWRPGMPPVGFELEPAFHPRHQSTEDTSIAPHQKNYDTTLQRHRHSSNNTKTILDTKHKNAQGSCRAQLTLTPRLHHNTN